MKKLTLQVTSLNIECSKLSNGGGDRSESLGPEFVRYRPEVSRAVSAEIAGALD